MQVELVIADLSGRNANAFYGTAQSYRRYT
jgi:hypothetical protein